MLDTRCPEYPPQKVTVSRFSGTFDSYFPKPGGLNQAWPPPQLSYLHDYLKEINCKSVVLEAHYIDRDYIDDTALFYARSLRPYRNYCQRVHFFDVDFDQQRFDQLIQEANGGAIESSQSFLQDAYLGFMVVRPLPGCPVGRTVLKTYPQRAEQGHARQFDTVRKYRVHLAAFELTVLGLAFQQQDQGVSACATTALWTSLHCIAHRERLAIPTPAVITESASRYLLVEGRSLPSGGLTVEQISEAIRAAGLSPLVFPSLGFEEDRTELHGYITSGFAPVIAVILNNKQGHAVCGVGVKLVDVLPQTNPDLHYRDASTAVKGIYVHDDQIGPYESASLGPFTQPEKKRIATALDLKSGGFPILHSIIVPLPRKIRLALAPVRLLGAAIAQTLAQLVPALDRQITLHCRYRAATTYLREAYSFGLTSAGIAALITEIVLSRYIAVIELSLPSGPLLDVLIDSTETQASPSALACVRRVQFPAADLKNVEYVASRLGTRLIA